MAGPESLARRAAHSLRQRGTFASAAIAVEEVLGTARFGRASGGTHPGASATVADAERLESSRYRTLRRTLAAVPADARGGFVDLGCGRGRALQVAAANGFAPVIGVELDSDLAADARKLANHRIHVVEGDATGYRLPDHIGTVFMFNPFGAESLRRVLANIDDAQRRRPRPISVAYLNPLHRSVLEAGGFKPHWQDVDAVVLVRNEAPAASSHELRT